jgi:HEAT repeat protein
MAVTTKQAKIDWSGFGDDLYQCARDQLLAQFASHPEQQVYAAAFHHIELDQALAPLFGYQSEEQLQRDSGTNDPVERWDCATWPKVQGVEDFLRLRLAPLEVLKDQLTPAKWQATVRQLENVLVGVCKKLSSELKGHCATLGADFAVLVLDDDFRLTPKCVPKALLFRLFPHLDAPRQRAEQLARLPLEQQVDIHLAALDSGDVNLESDAAKALEHIGPFAALAVARSMATKTEVWRHAMLLDQFRVRDPDVIDVLKSAALRHSSRYANWPAIALATLGEYDFLIDNPALSDECLVSAVLHPLMWRNQRLGPQALNYEPIERLMHARPSTADLLLHRLERGSFNEIKPTDLATALAGATHSFAGIRRHAAYVLGRKALGRKNGPRIVAAMLPLLADANAKVRYIALLTLQTWSVALPQDRKPFEQLAHNDPDENIRQIATQVLATIASR